MTILLTMRHKSRLRGYQFGIVPLGERRKEDEMVDVFRHGHLVLRTGCIDGVHYRTTVCHTRGDTQKDGGLEFFTQVKTIRHHVVRLLLVTRLQTGDHGKLGIEPAVLLVLGRVHGRIVGRQHDQTSVHTRDRGIHERIGAHVHTHVLHTHQRPFPHIRHTQGSLHGCLLIRRPTAVEVFRL